MTEARWMLYAKKADFDKIAEQYHISPVTARIIRNRGLKDMEDIGRYLYGSVEQLHNPHLLPDMDRAVEILGEKGSRIAISDVGVGILFAQAALEGASLNVFINTGLMKNAERACELNETANRLIAEGQAYKERIYAGVCVQLKS